MSLKFLVTDLSPYLVYEKISLRICKNYFFCGRNEIPVWLSLSQEAWKEFFRQRVHRLNSNRIEQVKDRFVQYRSCTTRF